MSALVSSCAQRPNVTVNAGCVACNQTNQAVVAGANSRVATGKIEEFKVTVPAKPGDPVLYIWRNATYRGREAFMPIVQAELASDVAKITPSATPPIGSLRLILPIRPPLDLSTQTNTTGSAEVAESWPKFWQLVDGARPGAIEKSGLFSSVTVETSTVVLPDAGAADFVLWYENGNWKIRYRRNNVFDVGGIDSTNLVTWMGAITGKARTIKNQSPSSLTFEYKPNGPVYFAFAGKDYYALDTLDSAMAAEFSRRAQLTKPVVNRVGGRVKIVLTTTRMEHINLTMPNEENMRKAQEAGKDAVRQYWLGAVEALRVGKVFDDFTVVTEDLSDVALDNYDYVMWQTPGSSGAWRFRVKGKTDAYSVATTGGMDVAEFPAILNEAIRHAGQPAK